MYNLHHLGWYSFQQLAVTVAKEIFGQTVSSFLPSKDGGRDGCFTGTWIKHKRESVEGKYVFQCKFTNRLNRRLKPSDLDDELEKVQKLVNDGICDFYILFTNNGVSGTTEKTLSKRFANIGVKYFKIYDNEWIVQTIKENSRLRIMVPRVYGLGDLSQILDARVYDQGKELLASLKDEFGKFVITSSYKRAANAINKHGFVLLIGGPASGKTTIASSLAMAAMDLWKSMTMKLWTVDQVVKHWNPNEPGQFFWIDDAFGVTRYESSLVDRWNHAMPHVTAMIKKNVRIIMTSRDYIYEDARKDLKIGAFPLLNESMVVIDVLKMTDEEKRQILYNHIKMGDQPKEFKTNIKPFLEPASSLKEFLPETARRLGTALHTKGLFLTDYHVKDFVIRQREFFIDLLHNLDKHLIAALALIYMNDERLVSPLALSTEELKSVEQLDSSKGKCVSALQAMRNNLVQLVTSEADSYWKFKHPTIGDAFSEFIKDSPELIEVYLRGCDVEKLLHQVSCGNLNLKNTIAVPSKFFELMLTRLSTFTSSGSYKNEFSAIWGAKRDLLEFLAKRCSKTFLELYIIKNKGIYDTIIAPTHYLEISAEVELISKLHSLRLLPEIYRSKFVEKVSDYALGGKNLYVFRLTKISSLFTTQELSGLRQKVVDIIVPLVDKIRIEKENEFEPSEDPERHMSPLVEVLEILESEFNEHPQIVSEAKAKIETIKIWVIKNEQKNELEERERLADEQFQELPDKDRSIFDDIDSDL
jgi:hypothetical protein